MAYGFLFFDSQVNYQSPSVSEFGGHVARLYYGIRRVTHESLAFNWCAKEKR